jgi:hypothetical protein
VSGRGLRREVSPRALEITLLVMLGGALLFVFITGATGWLRGRGVTYTPPTAPTVPRAVIYDQACRDAHADVEDDHDFRRAVEACVDHFEAKYGR